MKKILSLVLVSILALTALCVPAVAEQVGEPFAEKVSITMMNSKPEITAALQAAADIFGAAYNVKIEVTETSSPGDELAKRAAEATETTAAEDADESSSSSSSSSDGDSSSSSDNSSSSDDSN